MNINWSSKFHPSSVQFGETIVHFWSFSAAAHEYGNLINQAVQG